MSLLLFSIDLRWFCYFIMFYFKLTNGAIVKLWMVKCCNGEIRIKIGRFVFDKYRIYSFVLFSNTTFLQQRNQSITFNFWSLTTSTEIKFMLSNQTTTERRVFIRVQPIIMRDILTLIWIAWIQQSQEIHYCNHPVLVIAPDLNMTYSVLRFLISFLEAPWYGLVYYVQAIFTTWWG